MLGVDDVLGSLKPGKRATSLRWIAGCMCNKSGFRSISFVLMVCSFIGPSLPRKAFLFFRCALCRVSRRDAGQASLTYGTHPAIGEHSNVITPSFNLPLSFLSTISKFVLFLFSIELSVSFLDFNQRKTSPSEMKRKGKRKRQRPTSSSSD